MTSIAPIYDDKTVVGCFSTYYSALSASKLKLRDNVRRLAAERYDFRRQAYWILVEELQETIRHYSTIATSMYGYKQSHHRESRAGMFTASLLNSMNADVARARLDLLTPSLSKQIGFFLMTCEVASARRATASKIVIARMALAVLRNEWVWVRTCAKAHLALYLELADGVGAAMQFGIMEVAREDGVTLHYSTFSQFAYARSSIGGTIIASSDSKPHLEEWLADQGIKINTVTYGGADEPSHLWHMPFLV